MERENAPPEERNKRTARTITAVDRVNTLTQTQRDAAMDTARRRIAGPEPGAGVEPQIADFERSKRSKYPPIVMGVITILCVVMLIAAFLPSAIRLHAVGFDAFAKAISQTTSIYVAALCIVLMAETGQVIFSLAAATNADRWQRRGLMLGAFICTAIALSGNAVAVGAHAQDNAFAFLETFAPPVLVLITAQILKTQMLHAIEDRHIAHQEFAESHRVWEEGYDTAVRYWQQHYEDAHHNADWMRVYANALRDALRDVNKRSAAVLRELTDDDWRALVLREIATEQWFVRAESRALDRAADEERRANAALKVERDAERQAEREASQSRMAERSIARPSGRAAGQRTRELDDAVTQDAEGSFTATCPHCESAFTGKPTHRAAMNALVAHVRHKHKTHIQAQTDPAALDAEIAEAQMQDAIDQLQRSMNGKQ